MKPGQVNIIIIVQQLLPGLYCVIKQTRHILAMKNLKKLENFGGHLLSEDDHSYWAPPYWNITKETFTLGRTEL